MTQEDDIGRYVDTLEKRVSQLFIELEAVTSDGAAAWAQVQQLEKERDTYAELAANKCVIQKVNDELGQQTLTSVANYRASKERIVQLQEEVESLASSLLQALQGEKNAISGFKAGLSAAGKFNAEVWGFLYRNCDPMDMTLEDQEWYDSLRERYGES